MEPAQIRGFAPRPRDYVGVSGPDAEAHLNRMLSNDVASLAPGESCDALLLTPKARVVAVARVLRRAPDDFLLLTESGWGESLARELIRTRFAARASIGLEEHTSLVVLGSIDRPRAAAVLPNEDYGVPCVELLDPVSAPEGKELPSARIERLRIEAGTPVPGREIDDRVMPAEAGLVERAVSFTKGCYPGQEPVARLHYRGHANRGLRVLRLPPGSVPSVDDDVLHDGRPVGRITSAVATDGGVVALAYVRTEVADDASLSVEGVPVSSHERRPPPPASRQR